MVLIVDLRIDMPAISRSDHGGRRLIVVVSPGADLDFGMSGDSRRIGFRQGQRHKYAWMTLESGLQKGTRNHIGVVGEKLRLDAMDARRLLQGFDDVSQQA